MELLATLCYDIFINYKAMNVKLFMTIIKNNNTQHTYIHHYNI